LKPLIACCSHAIDHSFLHHPFPKDRLFFRKNILLLRDSGALQALASTFEKKLPAKVHFVTGPVTRTFAKVHDASRITFSLSDESGSAFLVKNIETTNGVCTSRE